MSIQTLQSGLFPEGRTFACLVRTVDPRSGDLTVDYEVLCDEPECVRYICTRLSEAEARAEIVEHARQHTAEAIPASWAEHRGDLDAARAEGYFPDPRSSRE